ncbi:hypothetical protein A2631_02400 [Candidatus Daviesbacteria bacterium RIFCSPHIGHO2_01_FULL_44_29]|uniref:Uncharacterized protein n=1 Tax=Candidatus Daviesbacteria bacterium RIFCSPHIGHO2_02_FULL_43_12 TaxID=1797776 RepID=A0A1F5KK19_9BACT|nr:MAG: hypothetical protein A2631_02400 [Candidatus Daviesbacteria bacterium RIFCSPHIGHO2_01_FULL_44_29]OGE41242.1 MAG: hypothetical protein A3D25_01795 [Candidatus Daviesbacteria bacterium RIFCSPHIGHO2_02_FULL_43_12]OGE41558.1 MAG: hypothetical protein A3E86_00225 [Candidatus Daviesbacteria bacterium RIFCSPHIGHO2_12_FULL_47_45]OGE69443.1 MAG: hypothetical protein A3B55_03535 [Candidatus Daviesbacteria bacterium RIFCSPLOWO2_01_FULL_43_15]
MERTAEKSQLDKETQDPDQLTTKVEKGIYKPFSAADPNQTTSAQNPIPIKINPKFKDPFDVVSQNISETITDVNVSVGKGTKKIWEMATAVFTDQKKS